jgi:7,8-dihydropterin-6-yl-methyl-4-(beta-D-ribofuranosyl)aminobenzene 5'-phosphate synthase
MKSPTKKWLLLLVVLGTMFSFAYSQVRASNEDTQNQLMEQAIKGDPALAALFNFFGDPYALLARFNEGKQKAEEQWQQKQSTIRKIKNLGTAKTLKIIPLIDWYTRDESLKGEPGVSYLIKTDQSTILFDVGRNRDQSDPSPLLHNMKQLGVTLDSFDTLVISHNHGDHVGGRQWGRQKTFSLTNHQISLGQKRVYTPLPMTYPGLNPIYAENPVILSKGVATIGVISRHMFFLGPTPEQALAVNVDDRGIVLIVGCGHQTLSKILERAEALFDDPIYGLIGGLHYPVTDSRAVTMSGIKLQMYIGTGKFPWKPVTIDEVQNNIVLMKKHNPGVVGLSPHDSCDASLEAFHQSFPGIYKEIKVGEKIVIGNQ